MHSVIPRKHATLLQRLRDAVKPKDPAGLYLKPLQVSFKVEETMATNYRYMSTLNVLNRARLPKSFTLKYSCVFHFFVWLYNALIIIVTLSTYMNKYMYKYIMNIAIFLDYKNRVMVHFHNS